METEYARLLSIGRFHAAQQGLAADPAEDCAIEFVEKMLNAASLPASDNGVSNTAWIHHCAKNFALNYVRHIARRKGHEVSCSLLVDGEARYTTAEDQEDADNPQAVVLQNEFWQKIFTATNLLCPRQKAYFYLHHVRGETIQEIAGAIASASPPAYSAGTAGM